MDGEAEEPLEKTKKFRGQLGRFKKAAYQLECGDRNELLSSPSVGRFRAFRRFRVSKDRLELFEECVLNIDEENFYRVGDRLFDPDDELGQLGEFINDDRSHTLIASLVDPSSPIPPALL